MSGKRRWMPTGCFRFRWRRPDRVRSAGIWPPMPVERQVLRYGTARELCLGLEVVTPDGDIWNGLYKLRKNNTGYDLRDLFVGSEGTLGVITAAVLKLFPRPRTQQTAFVALRTPDDALRFLTIAQKFAGFALTTFELMSRYSLELVTKHFPHLLPPLPLDKPYFVLLELCRERTGRTDRCAVRKAAPVCHRGRHHLRCGAGPDAGAIPFDVEFAREHFGGPGERRQERQA